MSMTPAKNQFFRWGGGAGGGGPAQLLTPCTQGNKLWGPTNNILFNEGKKKQSVSDQKFSIHDWTKHVLEEKSCPIKLPVDRLFGPKPEISFWAKS